MAHPETAPNTRTFFVAKHVWHIHIERETSVRFHQDSRHVHPYQLIKTGYEELDKLHFHASIHNVASNRLLRRKESSNEELLWLVTNRDRRNQTGTWVSVSLGSDLINGLSGALDSKPTADELHICLPIVSTITRHLGKRYGTTLHTSIQ